MVTFYQPKESYANCAIRLNAMATILLKVANKVQTLQRVKILVLVSIKKSFFFMAIASALWLLWQFKFAIDL